MTKFKELSKLDIEQLVETLKTIGTKKTVEHIVNRYGVAPRTGYDWVVRLKNLDEDTVRTTLDGRLYGPMYVKGTSTLVNENGKAKLQWIKEDAKKSEEGKAFLDAVAEYVENNVKEKEPIRFSKVVSEDIMVKYPIADAHIGLLTYKEQVGEDWGLDKSVAAFRAGIDMLVNSSPSCEECLILDLGDMVHVADSTGKTRGHGHVLDVDGRLDDIYLATIEVIENLIDSALENHKKVTFRKTIGNHDGDTSLALGVFLKKLYKNEPRVVIEAGPGLFWWYRFGNTLHYSTHGHTVKQKELPEIIASDCKDIWSNCKYVYADTGHVHHQQIIETRTVKCESHNTVVPGDSYNYGSGYRSVYDKEYGEIARNIVNMEMIYAKLRS